MSDQHDRDVMRHMLHNAGKRPKVFTSEDLEDAKLKLMKDMEKFIARDKKDNGGESNGTIALMQMRGTLDMFFSILGLEDHTSYYE